MSEKIEIQETKPVFVAWTNTDPKDTATVVTECPECAQGKFDYIEYLDAQGNPISYSEE